MGTYSQSYQDEIVRTIFNHVELTERQRFAVELGFNSADLRGGSGSNVARLVLESGWRCLLIDGEHENSSINLHKHMLSASNVNQILTSYSCPVQLGYVSIDLDSIDLWIFRSVAMAFSPAVVSVEYNCNFPLGVSVAYPNDSRPWFGDSSYGSSLSALIQVAHETGYRLLWVVRGLDAIFIRTDLVQDGTESDVPSTSTWIDYAGFPAHRRTAPDQLPDFLDYGTWVATGGDLGSAVAAARPICEKYLT